MPPLPGKELDEIGLAQFPMVMGGIVPVVNLDGVKPGDLTIDGPTLAKIFLGDIKTWDDPAIKKLNPSVKLPNQAIAIVHRSDGSGTTFNFAYYLAERQRRLEIEGRSQHVGTMAELASAPKATKASPTMSATPRARSGTSSTLMPSRTS